MDEMFSAGERSIVAYLHSLTDVSGAGQLDVESLPLELRAIGGEIKAAVTALHESRRLLEHNAYTDQLTGVGNRGGFDREMDRRWAARTPLTCAYIDLDHLKRCNDFFGHAEGNRYILSVCRALSGILQDGERLFRVGGDEFILLSGASDERELECRLEACREALVESTSRAGSAMVYSFSYGCSYADPGLGDSRRQMTLDADRKMYRYKLLHRAQRVEPAETPRQAFHDTPFNDRIFQALSMTSENRYLFVINLDTTESQWSLSAVRDFNLPSEHPFNSIAMWLERVHPEDRGNVRAELANIEDGTWHFHTMQYRVMSSSGEYTLCDCTGFRLDGTDTEPTVYAGCIVNRSMAGITDSVTGLGDSHALVTAIGEARRNAHPTGLVAVKVDHIAEVNARYGYEAGDRVLSETAGCLVELSRAKARVFRGHGTTLVAVVEEFGPHDLEDIVAQIEDHIGSPVLLGTCHYLPPVRVASMHFDVIDVQPASIMAELHARVKRAPQIPGTPLE